MLRAVASQPIPTLKSLQAKITGPIGMTTAWRSSCELGFGTPTHPGITIEAEIEFPNHLQSEGTLEFVQLVATCRHRRNAAGNNQRLRSNGYVLDTVDPYDSLSVHQKGGIVKLQTEDSPGNPVGHNIYITINDRFKTWVLWRAKGKSRIALGMVEWNWAAEAHKTSQTGNCAVDWTVSNRVINGGIGATTTKLPKWFDNVINLFFEAGSCK